jgi:divinyl protochlorophyllide a 8-vinyl-reductase
MTAHAPALSEGPARIGPNAIIRVAEALDAQLGEADRADIFRAAGLDTYLHAMPETMVDEREVIALHHQLRPLLGAARAREVSREAGLRTGDYLLANRIPRPAQWLLRLLPPFLASRVLLKAITANSWTFAGSGTFAATPGHPVRISIAACPLCRDVVADESICDYYAATFERLFRALVSRHARVTETACQATGATACTFEVRWSR